MVSNTIYSLIGSLAPLVFVKVSSRMFCVGNSCCKHSLNTICRKSTYYETFNIRRLTVPNNRVSWKIHWNVYLPTKFSHTRLKNADWADPEIGAENFNPKWNDLDEGINRRSYDHNEPIQYLICEDYPLNPRGRTGLGGRGVLGRWGPNHAADAIVTRWKTVPGKTVLLDPETELPMLQFIAIRRKDCGKWAIPGGFVEINEEASIATLRELFEEAINIKKFSDAKRNEVIEFFKNNSKQVYKGYVDDPRNTDNAWIETTAFNFHDEAGTTISELALDARDDAVDAAWIDIGEDMENVYETHLPLLESVLNSKLDDWQLKTNKKN